MFLALFLVPLGAWLATGAPTDHSSLAILGSAFVTAIIVFIKEILGAQTAAVATTTTTKAA